LADLKSKLDTVTTKESNWNAKKEEFRTLLNAKQILPKNTKEP